MIVASALSPAQNCGSPMAAATPSHMNVDELPGVHVPVSPQPLEPSPELRVPDGRGHTVAHERDELPGVHVPVGPQPLEPTAHVVYAYHDPVDISHSPGIVTNVRGQLRNGRRMPGPAQLQHLIRRVFTNCASLGIHMH